MLCSKEVLPRKNQGHLHGTHELRFVIPPHALSGDAASNGDLQAQWARVPQQLSSVLDSLRAQVTPNLTISWVNLKR